MGKYKDKPIAGIYRIESPNGMVYIGQSVDLNARKRFYSFGVCKEQVKLYNSIKKYGWAAHKFDIVIECLPEELNELEVYYIKLFNTMDPHGLNLRSGGDSGGNLSDQTKARISVGGKAAWTDERRAKLSERRRNARASAETRKRMSDRKKQLIASGEINMRRPKKTDIKVIDITTGKIYPSINEAARSTGVYHKWLRRNLFVNAVNKSNFRVYKQ